MTRDRSWQRSYLVACVVQLIVEILIFESLECMWVHYGIPSLVADEVEKTINHIHDTIDEAFSLEADSVLSQSTLDAPSYFFVSTNLAEIFPQPFESAVVSAYRSIYPSPGGYVHDFRQSKSNTQSLNLRENKTWGVLKRVGFTAFLTSVIQKIGTFPVRAQKLLIHVVQPIVLAFLFIAWIHIASSLLLTILSCMALILFGMGVVRWLLAKRQIRQTTSNQNPRRGSLQQVKYTNTISLRKMTSTEANPPSTTIEHDEEERHDESPEPVRTVDKVTVITKHRPLICIERSDEEKADPDSESNLGSSYDSKNSLEHSMGLSAEPFDDPFDDYSSFEVDDPVQDAYEISDSSEDSKMDYHDSSSNI